jgi:hypothetical protein
VLWTGRHRYSQKTRNAAELNNKGFSGEFAYGMFDLPAGRADRFGLPWPGRADDGEDDPTSSKASGSKSKATSSKTISSNHTPARANCPKIPQVPNDKSDDDDDEAYAFHPKGGIPLKLSEKGKIK